MKEVVTVLAKFFNTVMKCIVKKSANLIITAELDDSLLVDHVASVAVYLECYLMACRHKRKNEPFSGIAKFDELRFYLFETVVVLNRINFVLKVNTQVPTNFYAFIYNRKSINFIEA